MATRKARIVAAITTIFYVSGIVASIAAGVEVSPFGATQGAGNPFQLNTASIGTANFDNRSFRLNFEVTALITDQAFGEQMASMLERDFAHAELIDVDSLDERPFWWRLGVNLSRLAAPVL
jgi:hypothetical protein